MRDLLEQATGGWTRVFIRPVEPEPLEGQPPQILTRTDLFGSG